MNLNPAHINEPVQKEFLSVIKEYERVIYKVCYLYTTRNATLGDLYQEVILNLWKAYPKFRKECKISTWIYRIALNTCISFIRKEKNVPEIVALTRDISGALLDMRRHTYRPFLLDSPLTVHPGSLLGFVLRPLPEPDPDR